MDFDWSNARQQWSTDTPMGCQERLVEQAQMIKAQKPTTKVVHSFNGSRLLLMPMALVQKRHNFCGAHSRLSFFVLVVLV